MRTLWRRVRGLACRVQDVVAGVRVWVVCGMVGWDVEVEAPVCSDAEGVLKAEDQTTEKELERRFWCRLSGFAISERCPSSFGGSAIFVGSRRAEA